MKEKSRNTVFAKTINNLFRVYWFIVRPKTKGVKALVFNRNRILMVRLTYYPDTWTFPGGGVNRNENSKMAVIRECVEEVGIKLQNPTFIQILDFNHEYKKDVVYVYREDVKSSDFKIDNKEVSEACWFNLNNLPNMGKNAIRILNTLKKF